MQKRRNTTLNSVLLYCIYNYTKGVALKQYHCYTYLPLYTYSCIIYIQGIALAHVIENVIENGIGIPYIYFDSHCLSYIYLKICWYCFLLNTL